MVSAKATMQTTKNGNFIFTPEERHGLAARGAMLKSFRYLGKKYFVDERREYVRWSEQSLEEGYIAVYVCTGPTNDTLRIFVIRDRPAQEHRNHGFEVITAAVDMPELHQTLSVEQQEVSSALANFLSSNPSIAQPQQLMPVRAPTQHLPAPPRTGMPGQLR